MNEHHTQRIDFGEHGYIEATRDDTDEIQDLRLKAFMPNGSLIREKRLEFLEKYSKVIGVPIHTAARLEMN